MLALVPEPEPVLVRSAAAAVERVVSQLGSMNQNALLLCETKLAHRKLCMEYFDLVGSKSQVRRQVEGGALCVSRSTPRMLGLGK